VIPAESLSVSLSTLALIALAEIGDKSQLVCMTLAARHRHHLSAAGGLPPCTHAEGCLENGRNQEGLIRAVCGIDFSLHLSDQVPTYWV